jgi:hypothetical protein
MDRNDFSGNLRNYNGEGRWSVEMVQERYREYCDALHIEGSHSLTPREHSEGEVRWIYPIMDEVIKGIDESDGGCIALGVDFVEEDARFPFGARLKSNTARALRRVQLTESQKVRLRERIATMLILGLVPREMREYAKLLRTVGVGEQWPRLEQNISRDNRHAMRFYKVLRAAEGLPL